MLSSANAQEYSLTVKAILTGTVTWLSIVLGAGHIALPWDLVTQIVDSTVQLVQNLLVVVSTVTALAGLVRKLWKTIQGTNAVLKQQ